LISIGRVLRFPFAVQNITADLSRLVCDEKGHENPRRHQALVRQ